MIEKYMRGLLIVEILAAQAKLSGAADPDYRVKMESMPDSRLAEESALAREALMLRCTNQAFDESQRRARQKKPEPGDPTVS